MKALLDTNIIIHRETNKIVNQDIGILFKWLDKAGYTKTIHKITFDEIQKFKNTEILSTFNTKLDSYEQLKTSAPIAVEVSKISAQLDKNQNDINDSSLLNELYQGRVDIFITEDNKIHTKAEMLNIADRVFTINSFLEKIYQERPELISYDILSVEQKYFGNLNLNDTFFDSLKGDYPEFERWFNRKSNEKAYVTFNKENGLLLSFLYIKLELPSEVYQDITPNFKSKRRLKVGTFKVVSNGIKLGERFLKIIFDNALSQKVDEIYVTIFEKSPEQLRLVSLLIEWGFTFWGKKSNGESVYTRLFNKAYDSTNPKLTFPFIDANQRVFLVPIYPEYHTELMPDSILHNESKADFKDDQPHRNSLSKVYISRSYERDIKKGDLLVFYRTGGYYKSVVTTIGIVDDVFLNISNIDEFLSICKKRSVFTDKKLREHWNYKSDKPFLVNFLYSYSFPNRINLKKLIELGVIKDVSDAPRGFRRISKQKFLDILEETQSDESIIINKA